MLNSDCTYLSIHSNFRSIFDCTYFIPISGARLNTALSPDLKPGPGCPGDPDDHDAGDGDHNDGGDDGDQGDGGDDGNGNDDEMFRGQVSTSPTCLDGLLVTHCPRFQSR